MTPSKATHAPSLQILLSIVVIAAVFLITAVPAIVHDHKTSEKTGDFTHFYFAADAMRHGQNIYQSGVGGYIYPPLIAFLFQPLSLLSEHAAAVTWDILNAILSFLALIFAANEAATRWASPAKPRDPALPWIIAAAAALLASDKLRAIFTLGQTDCFMLLAFVGALHFMKTRPLLAGLIVGTSASIKYISLIFLPYFLLKRNWKAAASSIISFAVFMLLPAVEVGLSRALEYAATAFAGITRMLGINTPEQAADIHGITWPRSVSLTSAIFRFTRTLNLPDTVAILLTLVTLIAILAVIILLGRRHNVSIFQPAAASSTLTHLEWAVLVFLALAFSPQSTNRHMVLTLLIYTVAAAIFLVTLEKKHRIALALAALLLTLALLFPPTTTPQALQASRAIGGASCCALVLLLTILWTGTHLIARQPKP